MLTILLAMIQVVVPEFANFFARVELQSAFFAIAVFAYVSRQLWLNSHANVANPSRNSATYRLM
jgi:hypothetical protein